MERQLLKLLKADQQKRSLPYFQIEQSELHRMALPVAKEWTRRQPQDLQKLENRLPQVLSKES
jgi:hypothetical protein